MGMVKRKKKKTKQGTKTWPAKQATLGLAKCLHNLQGVGAPVLRSTTVKEAPLFTSNFSVDGAATMRLGMVMPFASGGLNRDGEALEAFHPGLVLECFQYGLSFVIHCPTCSLSFLLLLHPPRLRVFRQLCMLTTRRRLFSPLRQPFIHVTLSNPGMRAQVNIPFSSSWQTRRPNTD